MSGATKFLKEAALVPYDFSRDHAEGSFKIFFRSVVAALILFMVAFALAANGQAWALIAYMAVLAYLAVVASFNLARMYAVTVPGLDFAQAFFRTGKPIDSAGKIAEKNINSAERYARAVVLVEWFAFASCILLAMLGVDKNWMAGVLLVAGGAMAGATLLIDHPLKAHVSKAANGWSVAVVLATLAVVYITNSATSGDTLAGRTFLALPLESALPWMALAGFIFFWLIQWRGLWFGFSMVLFTYGFAGLAFHETVQVWNVNLADGGRVPYEELTVQFSSPRYKKEGDRFVPITISGQGGGASAVDTVKVEPGVALRFGKTPLARDSKGNEFRKALGAVDVRTGVVDPSSEEFWVLKAVLEPPRNSRNMHMGPSDWPNATQYTSLAVPAIGGMFTNPLEMGSNFTIAPSGTFFAPRPRKPQNNGVNFRVNEYARVFSAGQGIVASVLRAGQTYGEVTVNHGRLPGSEDEFWAVYSQLSEIAPNIEPNQRVTAESQIGWTAEPPAIPSPGDPDEYQFRFALYRETPGGKRQPVDPLPYIGMCNPEPVDLQGVRIYPLYLAPDADGAYTIRPDIPVNELDVWSLGATPGDTVQIRFLGGFIIPDTEPGSSANEWLTAHGLNPNQFPDDLHKYQLPVTGAWPHALVAGFGSLHFPVRDGILLEVPQEAEKQRLLIGINAPVRLVGEYMSRPVPTPDVVAKGTGTGFKIKVSVTKKTSST